MFKLSAAIIAAALTTASLSSAAFAQASPGAELGAGITDNPSANRSGGDLNGPATGLGGDFGPPPSAVIARGAEANYHPRTDASPAYKGDVGTTAAARSAKSTSSNSGSTQSTPAMNNGSNSNSNQ